MGSFPSIIWNGKGRVWWSECQEYNHILSFFFSTCLVDKFTSDDSDSDGADDEKM